MGRKPPDATAGSAEVTAFTATQREIASEPRRLIAPESGTARALRRGWSARGSGRQLPDQRAYPSVRRSLDEVPGCPRFEGRSGKSRVLIGRDHDHRNMRERLT